MKVFKEALNDKEPKTNFILMLEDDSILPLNFKEQVLEAIANNPEALVINFDERSLCEYNGYSKWGMAAVLIDRSLLKFLLKEFDPQKSDYMNNYNIMHRNYDEYGPYKCYHDILFFNLLFNYNIKMACVPIVGSNIFKSSINMYNRKSW